MKKFLIALAGILLMITSCEKEDLSTEKAAVTVDQDINTTVFTMSSNDNKGFSVEYLKLANSGSIKPDFIIIPQTSMTGDVMSPFLSHPNFERRFILSREFDDAKSAGAFFDSYNITPEGEPLQQFALNIRANQIWLVKTKDGHFCKLLILETKTDKTSDFVQIKFKAQRMV